MKHLSICLCLFTSLLTAHAETPAPEENGLPNVLLLGDSISFGYEPYVAEKLKGKANVYRVAGDVAATIKPAGGLKLDTTAALKNLDTWLMGKNWAVIHFNWGLHDLKVTKKGEHQVPLPEYARNLRDLLTQLKRTKAKLIWASTTPIPPGTESSGFPRHAGDEIAYNDEAQRIMEESYIPIDDLHGLVAPDLERVQLKTNVHFNKQGSELMAGQAAGLISEALEGKALPPITPTPPSKETTLATPAEAAAELDIPFAKIGTLATRNSAEIAGSDWSIGCETMDRDYVKYDNYKEYLGPLGAKSARLQGGWAKTEKEPGVYRWEWLDTVIDDLNGRGIAPWLQLSYGNPIYKDGGTENIFSPPPKGEAAAKWDAWVTATVRRYKDKVHVWEIWNEPDISHDTTPDDYVSQYVRTAEIIRKEDPSATIYALSMAREVNFAEDFLAQLAKLGKLDLVDEITFHTYPHNPDDLYTYDKLKEYLAKYPEAKIKLREGENGAPSGPTSGALKRYPWSELTQAKWNLRRMLAYHGNGVPYNLFTISDFAYPIHGRNAKGLLLVKEDGSVDRPKQAYVAAQYVFATLDHSFALMPNALVSTNAEEPLAFYGYRKNGKSLFTVWFKGQTATEKNTPSPINFTAVGDISEPVYVDVRTGSVYAIPAENWSHSGSEVEFTNIPIYDSPVFIADKSTLAIKP